MGMEFEQPMNPILIQHPLKILQVNTVEKEGGAAVIAWNLYKAYAQKGYYSYYSVGKKQSSDDLVIQIPELSLTTILTRLEAKFAPFCRISELVKKIQKGQKSHRQEQGWENFHFPGSRKILQLHPLQPDIVHLHNLHGGFFDLRYLAQLSHKKPVIITMHDMWLITGHCAYPMECKRWQSGCGDCPDLLRYPPILADGTARNLHRKQRIYRRSNLYLATPSQWLMDQVEKSVITTGVIDARVINNGIDTRLFKPAPKEQARLALSLPMDARILMFVSAKKIKNHPFKDYRTISESLQIVEKKVEPSLPVLLLALGQEGQTEKKGNVEIRFLPYVKERSDMALIYQAADLYVHAAKADVFPNSVLEALACGTPVVATAVGGIPEQVEDGQSGILTKPADPNDMANAILSLLENDPLRSKMGNFAAEIVQKKFTLDHQVKQYLEWYQQILESRYQHVLSKN
jgi:glycosyltransferase involved in cell wall biosynthesis